MILARPQLSHMSETDNPFLTREELEKQRKKNGQCGRCGEKTFKFVKIGWYTRKVPLTIPGVVEHGQCLSCNPKCGMGASSRLMKNLLVVDEQQQSSHVLEEPLHLHPIKRTSSTTSHRTFRTSTTSLNSGWSSSVCQDYKTSLEEEDCDASYFAIYKDMEHTVTCMLDEDEDANNKEESKAVDDITESTDVNDDILNAINEAERKNSDQAVGPAILPENHIIRSSAIAMKPVLASMSRKETAIDQIVTFMDDMYNVSDVQVAGCGAIWQRMQEYGMRAVREFIHAKGLSVVTCAVEDHPGNEDLTVDVLQILNFCAKKSEEARKFLLDGGYAMILNAMQEGNCASNDVCMQNTCDLTSSVAIDANAVKSILFEGGMSFLVSVMSSGHVYRRETKVECISALTTTCSISRTGRDAFAKEGGLNSLSAFMAGHESDVGLLAACCDLVAELKEVLGGQSYDGILWNTSRSMGTHAQAELLQYSACKALSALVKNTADAHTSLIAGGGLLHVINAITNHSHSKAVLKGCISVLAALVKQDVSHSEEIGRLCPNLRYKVQKAARQFRKDSK